MKLGHYFLCLIFIFTEVAFSAASSAAEDRKLSGEIRIDPSSFRNKASDNRQYHEFIKDCLEAIELNQVTDDLLNPAATEWRNCCGETMLHYAAIYHRSCIAAILISMGADVNAQDLSGNTPLHNAYFFSCRQGNDQEVSFSYSKNLSQSMKQKLKYVFGKENSSYVSKIVNRVNFEENHSMIRWILMRNVNCFIKNDKNQSFLSYMSIDSLKKLLEFFFQGISKSRLRLHKTKYAHSLKDEKEIRDEIVRELIRRRKMLDLHC